MHQQSRTADMNTGLNSVQAEGMPVLPYLVLGACAAVLGCHGVVRHALPVATRSVVAAGAIVAPVAHVAVRLVVLLDMLLALGSALLRHVSVATLHDCPSKMCVRCLPIAP